MFYVKHKEVTRSFNFSKVFNREDLPGYIMHYILGGERILVAYKTSRDHGVFTDNKIILFDSLDNFSKKQIYTIPYKSVSTISVTFDKDSAELELLLNNGYPVLLDFVNMRPDDKMRLRILYTIINRIICGQEPMEKDIKKLMNDEIGFNK